MTWDMLNEAYTAYQSMKRWTEALSDSTEESSARQNDATAIDQLHQFFQKHA